MPRTSHAEFEPAPDRPDPVALLEEQAATRVPELVPVRWGRMLVSPFTYYRGAALPMASDLATTPVSGLAVQACGDAHLSNFGIFGSAERRLVFDVNDFDETLPGPWEWDVKRLAASLEVAARDNGFPVKQRRDIVIGGGRQLPAGDARLRGHDQPGRLVRPHRRGAVAGRPGLPDDRAAAQEGRRGHRQGTDQGQHARGGQADPRRGRAAADHRPTRRCSSLSPSLLPGEADRAAFTAQLRSLIGQYRRTLETDRRYLLEQFEPCDMARKVVGVGSVGTRCWIVLFLGRDTADPLFLQVKEAERSVLSRFVGASKYANQGQRVVAGQRLMQAASDIFLGWQRTEAGLDGKARDFYVRQLRDWKFSLDVATMVPAGMRAYGEVCGWTLARAHARSGDRIAIAAYLGASDVFDRAIAEFAAAYADQNERDYQALAQAAAAGRITAEHGL